MSGSSHQLCHQGQSEDVWDIADTSGHLSLSCGKFSLYQRFIFKRFFLKIPGLIYRPEIEEKEDEEKRRFDRHYVRVWRVAMWVFLISRMLQPIIMVISDKELRLKTKVFLGLVVEERRIGTTVTLTNSAKA